MSSCPFSGSIRHRHCRRHPTISAPPTVGNRSRFTSRHRPRLSCAGAHASRRSGRWGGSMPRMPSRHGTFLSLPHPAIGRPNDPRTNSGSGSHLRFYVRAHSDFPRSFSFASW